MKAFRASVAFVAVRCDKGFTKLKIMLEAVKYIQSGLATFGLAGAGVGIRVVFSGLITVTSRNPALRPQLFI